MSEPIEPWDERSAELYEAVFAVDNHEAQVAYLHRVIDERVPDAASLLDVACGTGWHLEHFQRWYDVAGTDLSPAMLERARGRLRDARFIEADMREFDFGCSFDAVTCLSSSIAWMPETDALDAAVANMARHTSPGGVVIIEPWNDPTDDPTESLPWTRTVQADDLVISLMETTTLRGSTWVEESHYLIGTDGDIQHKLERAEFSAFTKENLRASFQAANLDTTYDPVGPLGRGLWIGIKR